MEAQDDQDSEESEPPDEAGEDIVHVRYGDIVLLGHVFTYGARNRPPKVTRHDTQHQEVVQEDHANLLSRLLKLLFDPEM